MAGRLDGGMDHHPRYFIACYYVCYRITVPYSASDFDQSYANPVRQRARGGAAGKCKTQTGEFTIYSLVDQLYPVGYSDMRSNAGDVFFYRYDDSQLFLWLFQVSYDRVDRFIYFLFPDTFYFVR